jgi:hypothetical protein
MTWLSDLLVYFDLTQPTGAQIAVIAVCVVAACWILGLCVEFLLID